MSYRLEMEKKTHNEINWAQPTAEDLAYLQTLSYEEHSELLKKACDGGIASGISKRSLKEIFTEAERTANVFGGRYKASVSR